jgi:hypothetical protein
MAVALLALLVAASGAAVAAIPSAHGTISACYDGKTGLLRVIDTERGQTCTSKEIGPLAFAAKGAVDAEATARQQADNEINRNIFEFKQGNSGEHKLLANSVANEAEARQAADDAEATARQQADNEINRNIFEFKQGNSGEHKLLTNSVADEAEARQAADSHLQEQIDALKQP